jgi:hypothetical protein
MDIINIAPTSEILSLFLSDVIYTNYALSSFYLINVIDMALKDFAFNTKPLSNICLGNLSNIITYLHYRRNFNPYTITLKSNNKQWALLETDIPQYIESKLKNKNWSMIFYGNGLEFFDNDIELGFFTYANNMVHDTDGLIQYLNRNNNYLDYGIKFEKTFANICINNKNGNTDRMIFYQNGHIGYSFADDLFVFQADNSYASKLMEFFEATFNMVIPHRNEIITKLNTDKDLQNKLNKTNYTFNKLKTISVSQLEDAFIKSFNCPETMFIENYTINITKTNWELVLNRRSMEYYFNTYEIGNTTREIEDTTPQCLTDNLNVLYQKNKNKIIESNLEARLDFHLYNVNLSYCYTLGTCQIIGYTFPCSGITKYTSRNIHGGKLNLEIDINKDGDFKVATVSEMYQHEKGLIVWKGTQTIDGSPCLVKLLIPFDAKIIPNGHGRDEYTKFRTNRCMVLNMYKIKLYTCSRCQRSNGLHKQNEFYYCRTCVLSLTGGYETIDFEKSEEVEVSYAKVRNFEYTKNKKIEIELFPTNITDCGNPGIYFFLNPDMLFDYCFGNNGFVTPTVYQPVKQDCEKSMCVIL